MKMRILLALFVFATFSAGTAMAQDSGNPDSLKIEVTLDTVNLQVAVEIWGYNDENTLNGISQGFTWGRTTANMTADSAIAEPLVDSFGIGPFFWENADTAISNANQRFLLGGASLFDPGITPDPSYRKWATYYFTLDSWSECDTLRLDTMTFNAGSAFTWSRVGGTAYSPVWGGPIDTTFCTGGGNTAPELAAIGDQTTDEGVNLNFGMSATDADGNALSFDFDTTGSGIPAAFTFTDNGDGTATFDWTPGFDDAGTYPVTVTVSDGTDTDSETFNIIVNDVAVNQAPELAAIGDQTTDEGVNLNFGMSATDADGDALSFDFDTTGSGIPAAFTFTDNGDGTATFDWTPGFEDAGTYPVTVTVSDGTETDSETFNIVVNDVNQAPELAAIGNQTTTEGVNLNFGMSATDGDGDALAFTLDTAGSEIPATYTFTDNGDGTATFDWTPADGDTGTYTVTVSVSDGTDTDSETFDIVVNPRDRELAITPDTLFFTATEGDPDPAPGRFDVTEVGADNIAFDATEAAAWFALDKTSGTTPDSLFVQVALSGLTAGSYLDSVEVSSVEAVNTVYGFVRLTLNPAVNNAPVLDSIGPKVVEEGNQLLFGVNASDPDGTTPVLSAEDLPTGASFIDNNDGTGDFDWTPGFDQAGVYNVTFIASDGALADSEVVEITVSEVNQAPVFTVVPQDTVTIDECDTLQVTVMATDADGDAVSIALDPVLTNMTFTDSGNGTAVLYFTPDTTQTGIYDHTLSVTDGMDTTFYMFTLVLEDCIIEQECNVMVLSDTLFEFYDTIYTKGVVVDNIDTLLVTSGGPEEFCYEVDCETLPSWLMVNPLSGCTPGEVEIMADATGLGGGSYSHTCWVMGDTTVCDPNPQPFTVVLHVEVIDTSVTADTLAVATVPAVPGAQVMVPINFTNACDLAGIETWLEYDNDVLTLDSASYVGSRVEHFAITVDTINPVMHTVHLNAADDTALVPPGYGLFAKLYFSIDCEAPHGFYAIDLLPDGVDNPVFTEWCTAGFEPVIPDFISGGIAVDTSANYVCGYVVDTAGNPIPGATVELWAADFPAGAPLMSTTANGSGAFAFSEFTEIPFDLWGYMEGYYPGHIDNLNYGQSGVMIVLTPVSPVYPTPYWNDFYCDENLYLCEPMPIGSVVDAYDPDGIHVGTYFVTEVGRYGFMAVYGEEPFNEGDQGAEDGDTISFYLNGVLAEVTGDVVWTTEYKQSEVCLDAFCEKCKLCPISEGWNLISWNVDTEVDFIEDVLVSIEGCIDVVLGFEQGALTYDPLLPEFSTLWNVDHLSGYWIKSSCDTVLEVCGLPVPVSTPIEVFVGWNLVSYLPEVCIPTEMALETIHNNLIVALGFDGGGLTYIPFDTLFNTLDELCPCGGYWVKMYEDDELIYPSGGPVVASPMVRQPLGTPIAKAAPTSDVTTSTRWMNVYSYELTLDGEIVKAGSEISAVTEGGMKIGAFTMVEDGKFGFMPVYADEGNTREVEGIRSGESFHLVVNGVKSNETFSFDGMGTRMEVGNLTAAKGSDNLPGEFSLSQNYPNPFNPTTTIEFSLPTTTQARIEIFNILGELVATPFDGVAEAGQNSVVWEGTNSAGQNVASGIYFYRLTADNNVETKKMTLLK